MFGLGKLFSKPSDHPLAREEAVTTLIAQLPTNDAIQTLQDVTHWLMLLASEDQLKNRAAKLFRIGQAAQSAERKIREQYIEASRLNKVIEERIWNTAYEFLEANVNAHLRCLLEFRAEKRSKGSMEAAGMLVRALRRLELQAHWFHLRYQPLPETFWEKLYTLIKIAEDDALFKIPISINATTGAETTAHQELLKLLMLTVIEPARMTKVQIALARHITNELGADFVWEDIPGSTIVFHVDFSKRTAPSRLTPTTERHFMARCFGPGSAVHKLVTAWSQVEQGGLPTALGISNLPFYHRADLQEVLLHLAQSWNAAPPVIKHQHFDKRDSERTPFFMHVCVTHGFTALHAKIAGAMNDTPPPDTGPNFTLTYEEDLDKHIHSRILEATREQQQRMPNLRWVPIDEGGEVCESWVIRDVSEHGFGISVTTTPEDWVRHQALIGIHYGTSEYQVGVIRRVASETVENTDVGVEILSTAPRAVYLRPIDAELTVWETAADTQAYDHIPAILLPKNPPHRTEDSLLLGLGSGYYLHRIYEMPSGDERRFVKLVGHIANLNEVEQVSFADVAPPRTHTR